MTLYDFQQLYGRMKANFEKVSMWDSGLSEAERDESLKIWMNVLAKVSLQDATKAIEILMMDENQPRHADGYPRRILAICVELGRNGRRIRPERQRSQEEILASLEQLNFERGKMGLEPMPLAEAQRPAKWPPEEQFMRALQGRFPGLGLVKSDSGRWGMHATLTGTLVNVRKVAPAAVMGDPDAELF